MTSTGKVLCTVLATALLVVGILYVWSPGFRSMVNIQQHAVQKADDATRYETRKLVEDTARAMISSYEADVLTYEQFKKNDNEEKASWADQARMRANKTASSYNAYVLKNSYIWAGNIPVDIMTELTPITE